jgi:hypothetical protein
MVAGRGILVGAIPSELPFDEKEISECYKFLTLRSCRDLPTRDVAIERAVEMSGPFRGIHRLNNELPVHAGELHH